MWVSKWPVSEGTGTSAVSGSTEQIRDNWNAMEEVIKVEHTSIASANAGEHTPGQSGFIGYDTKSNILALSSPGTGSLAYTHDTGEFLIYVPSGSWERLTQNYWSRIRKTNSGTQAISNDVWTKVTLPTSGSGIYDSLSEFSSNRFTVKAVGYYIIAGAVHYPPTTSNYQKAVAIYKNGVQVSVGRFYGSAFRTIVISDIIGLAAGDYLELFTSHLAGADVTIVGASLAVQRGS